MKTIHYIVSGRVQGVFFRYHTKKTADRLNIKGTVQNLPGGDVEVVARGDDDSLARLEDFLRQGPPSAEVNNIRRESLESEKDYPDFRIIH